MKSTSTPVVRPTTGSARTLAGGSEEQWARRGLVVATALLVVTTIAAVAYPTDNDAGGRERLGSTAAAVGFDRPGAVPMAPDGGPVSEGPFADGTGPFLVRDETGGPPPTAPMAPGVQDASGGDHPLADVRPAILTGAGLHGVTDDIVQFGIMSTDLAAASAVLGGLSGNSYEAEDTTVRAMATAVADYVNERGGIAGRKIELIFNEVDFAQWANSEGRQREHQKGCATFTEDNHVFAVVGGMWFEDNFVQCMVNSRTVMVPIGFQPYFPRERFERELSDLYYTSHWMLAERRESNMVAHLLRHDWLPADAKVGIIIDDQPGSRAGVENAMKPALAAVGVEVVEEIVYPDPIESPWSAYVLRMRSAGVTHVIFSGATTSVWAPFFLMKGAEDQQWFPQWGMAYDHDPQALPGLAPSTQLVNAVVMAATQGLDGEDYFENSTTRACREIEEQHDVPRFYATSFCETFFFVRDIAAQATEFSPAGFAGGVGRLGSSFESHYGLDGRTWFGPAHHDGMTLAVHAVYDLECGEDGAGCWRYEGDFYELS